MGMGKCLRSAEYVLVGGQEAQAGSKTVKHRTRGFERHLVPTSLIAVQTDAPTQVPAAFRMVAGALSTLDVVDDDYALTEDDINDPLDALWDAMKGKINLDVFCTGKFKRKVSKLSMLQKAETDMVVVRRFNQTADKKIVTVVEFYEGDSGTCRFNKHPWMRYDTETQESEAFGLDFRYGCLRMRQAPKAEPLGKTSAAKNGMITHTFGLQYVPKMGARWMRSEAEPTPTPTPTP
jgi:RNAse (barnase) inhibitor barstar